MRQADSPRHGPQVASLWQVFFQYGRSARGDKAMVVRGGGGADGDVFKVISGPEEAAEKVPTDPASVET
jgi:hypothetical protein